MKDAEVFLLNDEQNCIGEDIALSPEVVGLRIFDAPIFAVGDADDPMFAALRASNVVHDDYMLPRDWLPEGTRVLSFFAPFTQQVREANRARCEKLPAHAWLHGRWEGEQLLVRLRHYLRDLLVQAGHSAVIPMHDPRFTMLDKYAPNWSERHTAHICGLGTFGMSRGIITEKGMAGRLGSLVTDCPLPVTARKYSGRYDYCIQCGMCAQRCPVRCIDPVRPMDSAKVNPPCDKYLSHVRSVQPLGEVSSKRYGCGKCQTGVPCEDKIPV